jgi:nucleotide-binding universal stress UspA family protein
MMFTKLLVAVDGSTHSDRAVGIAVDIASHYESTITLIHVVHDPRGNVPHGLEELERLEHIHITERDLLYSAGLRMVLDAESHAYELGAAKVETVVRFGNPARVIVDYIDETMSPTDAVVMGRRGLGDLGGLLLGSVSHQVAHDATCAVITIQ